MTGPGYRCRDCQAEFPKPSFSEGPKFVDQETGEVVRFKFMRAVCPECLSYEIDLLTDPPLDVNRPVSRAPRPAS